MRKTAISLALLTATWASIGLRGDAAHSTEPAAKPAPAESTFQVEPGLAFELIAAEPLVVSPCALTFDERGRLFVVENRGYPTGPGEGQPPAGRIALLEDVDGDGRYDRRVEFADGLSFPNGAMPWRGGLIVTCAPDVLYLKDADGDGRAEERRVLLTGFSTKGSTQLRVSHPTLALDNWVYVTSGLTGGKITSPLAPERPAVEVGRTDVRFNPDTGVIEAADGGSQFGLTFDEFGRRFICYNRVHVQHVVLPSRALRRNPLLAFSDTVENCPEEMAPEPLKGHGRAARLFPISQNVTTADSHAGTFTAACATTIFRGAALPALYRGGVFACDPTGNLVHFDRLLPRGATFVAQRAHPGREVVASASDWFRPVFLANGPDGALYVCDMHRRTIEHPDYLPVEIRKQTDFEGGKSMGRIYRLAANAPATLCATRLADATTSELCQTLRDTGGWQQETAHRLLLERRDATSVVPLTLLLRNQQHDSPAAAVHALRLLDAFGAVDDDLLVEAMQHRAAPVREHAAQLAAPRLAELPRTALWLAGSPLDPDPQVRLQIALALGDLPGDQAAGQLADIAARDAADRWIRAAVFSGITRREPQFLAALIVCSNRKTVDVPELWYELGRILGARQAATDWPHLLEAVAVKWRDARDTQRIPLVTGIADSLRNQGIRGPLGPLVAVLKDPTPAEDELVRSLTAVLDRAIQTAGDRERKLPDRCWGAALAAHAAYSQVGDTLLALVDPQQPDELQTVAVRSLAAMPDESVATRLLDPARFVQYTPRLRDAVLAALVASDRQLPGVVAALEHGDIAPADVDLSLRRQLTEHRDEAIRARAGRLLGAAVSPDRAAIYEAHRAVLQLPSNPANGKRVFLRACGQCHRLDREGSPVGPDLFGIRNQPKETILLHILIPEREITPGFRAYTVMTKDGRVLSGLIASETPTSITLRQAQAREETLLRRDIEELVASRMSLMPQGLENTISHQEFADLLAYLKGEGAGATPSAASRSE